MSSKKDKFYLKLALNLAKQNEGLTSVNPSVGCVIVKDNKSTMRAETITLDLITKDIEINSKEKVKIIKN